MITDPDSPVVVGSYVAEDRAGTAAETLRSEGIDQIEIGEVTSGVWQLRVPSEDAQRALEHLQPQEQRSIQTHL